MSRKEAQFKVLEIGGKCSSAVSNSTNYLVVGEQDYETYGKGFKSSNASVMIRFNKSSDFFFFQLKSILCRDLTNLSNNFF